MTPGLPSFRKTTIRNWRMFPLILSLILLNSGCRLFRSSNDGLGGEGVGSRRNDPLFGGRYIPKTNLPTSDRESAGRSRNDPLFTTPAARDRSSSNSDLPSKEPYRPTIETTQAGLAAGSGDPEFVDDRNDRRGPGLSTGRGGPTPLRPVTAIEPLNSTVDDKNRFDQALAEIRRLGGKVSGPFRDGDDYVLQADLTVGESGSIRRYEGAGNSPAVAVSQLLSQIREDQR